MHLTLYLTLYFSFCIPFNISSAKASKILCYANSTNSVQVVALASWQGVSCRCWRFREWVSKESNWRGYWGSCKPLLAEVKEVGEDKFKREILKLCFSKKQLTYYEIAYQCKYDVLETNSYNDNIMSRIFRKDLHFPG